MAQLGAMVKYDLILRWRQRRMILVTVVIIALQVLFAIVSRDFLQGVGLGETLAQEGVFTQEARQQFVSQAVTPIAWSTIYVIVIMLIPVAMADAIPLDRQQGVYELLHGLPLSPGVYLTGKLLGVWASILISLLVAMGVVALSWQGILGALDIGLLVQVWLVGAIPLAIVNSGLSVMVASGQTTRRRGLAIGFAFTFAVLFLLPMGIDPEANPLIFVLNPGRPAIMFYFIQIGNTLPIVREVSATDVVLSLIGAFVELIAVWLGTWGWLRWRDGRA